MFRNRFSGGPSQPNNGRRNGSFAGAVRGGSNNNNGVVMETQETIDEGSRDLIRDDQRVRAKNSKFLYEQKLIMEGKRKHLAKGLILTFLLRKEDCSYPFMGKVLREAGFLPNQVKALKINEYRGTEAEVLFAEGTVLNIQDIQTKLQGASMDVTVSNFEGDEEVFLLEGLPLTDDHETMKEMIREAIWPFVKNVKEITPTTYKTEEEYFKGMFDGKYKVVVIPRFGKEVPNFVAIGSQSAPARVVYTKSRSAKKVMCQICYNVGHTSRDNDSCSGPRTWDSYVSDFNENWKSAADSYRESAAAEENLEMSEEMKAYSRAEEASQGKINELEYKIASMNEKMENLEVENDEMKNVMREKEEEIEKLKSETQMILNKVVSEAVGGSKNNSTAELSYSESEDSDSETITSSNNSDPFGEDQKSEGSDENWEVVKDKNVKRKDAPSLDSSPSNEIVIKKIKVGSVVESVSQLEINEFYEIKSNRGLSKGWLTEVKDQKMYIHADKKIAGKYKTDIFTFKDCTVTRQRKPSNLPPPP